MKMKPTLTRLLTMTLIVATMILGASSPSAACSCERPELSEAFELSDAVFIGEIDEIRRPGPTVFRQQEARYIFSVETVFKGDVYEHQSVVTHAQGATCGMEISGPGRFLMFATKTANGGPAPDTGEFASSLCSANALVGPDFDSAQFGEGFDPLAGNSPTGSAGLTSLAWGGLLAGTLGLLLVSTLIGLGIRRRTAGQG